MFDRCSFNVSANVNAMLEVFSCTPNHRRWLWAVEFAPEGSLGSEVAIPGVSHISICEGRME
jgi:hypothetical protein